MKTYPLVIEEPLGEGQGWYSKGHHSPYAFVSALNEEAESGGLGWEYEGDGPLFEDRDRVRIKHEWWRKGFPRGGMGEFAWEINHCDGPGRGVFPVTVLWQGW